MSDKNNDERDDKYIYLSMDLLKTLMVLLAIGLIIAMAWWYL